MKPSNLMIHAVVELVVLMAVVIYFQQKVSSLTAQVQKLGAVVQQQQGILHRHEKLLAQLFPGAPMYFSPVVDMPLQTPPPPPPPPPQPSDAAPPNMMPMVESLMGMLGTVMSVPPPESPPAPRATITEVDLERELEEELQELQEGRVEEPAEEEAEEPAEEPE